MSADIILFVPKPNPNRPSLLEAKEAECEEFAAKAPALFPRTITSHHRMIQPEPFNRFRFRRYARELSKAVQELSMPTIGEQLKAARADLAKARDEAATAVSGSADAAKAVLAEVSKVKAETADLLAEIAELTNGGPVLDETTPLPPAGPYPTYP